MTNVPEQHNEREFIVASNGVGIPMCDMPSAGLMSKWFSKPEPPKFAVESRRIIRVESEQIPKRILKHFRAQQEKVAPLRYKTNFYATVPTIGPLAISVMSMVTPSGQNAFFSVRTVVRDDGKLIDGGFHGFCSYLSDDDALVTMSNARLPKPREGVDRVIMNTDDPEAIVREHRLRMREYDIVPLEAAQVVDHVRRQNELDLAEYLERELLRPASTGEIARVRDRSRR